MVLQAQVGEQLLELAILLFQVLEPGQFRHTGARLFTFSDIKRRLAQAVFAYNLGYRLPAGLLLQKGHMLSLAESSLFQLSVFR